MLLTPTTTTVVQGKAKTGAAGPKPEETVTRNKKLRRDGEARNLSQQRREECKTVKSIIRQTEEMEYEEQAAKGWCLVNWA
jgi:hypothetical protein